MSYYHTKYVGFGKRVVGRGEDEQKLYAYLSSVAYGDTPQARQEKLNKFNLSKDWAIDSKLTTPDVVVMKNDKTKQIVHSVAGTRLSSTANRFRDLRSDLGIVLGLDRWGDRTKEVKSVVDSAKDKYKDNNHTLTGHSLGAKVSTNISRQTGLPAVVFNTGSSPLSAISDRIAKLFGRDHKDSKVTQYTTNQGMTIDPLSISGKLLGTANKTTEVSTVDPTKSNHHLGSFAVGAGRKKKPVVSKWIAHVKKYQAEHSCTYKEALSGASKSYNH